MQLNDVKLNKVDAVGFLVLVGIVGFGYFGVIYRQTQHLSETKERIAELTRLTLENDGIENILDQDKQYLQAIREKLNGYLEHFSTDGAVDSFLEEFASQAQAEGVSVSLLKPDAPVDRNWHEITPIHINLEGSYDGVYRIIRAVEAGDRMATVRRLQLQSEPNNRYCRATITLDLFGRKDK